MQVAAFNQEFVDGPDGLVITTELIVGSNAPHPIKDLVNEVMRSNTHTNDEMIIRSPVKMAFYSWD